MKKIVKLLLKIVGSLVIVIVLLVGGYVGYVALDYYRIADNTVLSITKNSTTKITDETSFSIMTYNVGFGAYDHDFSFFLDSGEMLDGTKVTGTGSKAKSKSIVKKNLQGSKDTLLTYQPDFVFMQEVDVDSDRAHHVNMYKNYQEAFPTYDSIYASNFHSAYLAYPLHDFHGKTEAGIVTLSKYQVDSSLRRSFPVDNSFPTKFFDLDRCFSVSRINLSSGKDLVLINVHLSAYDAGGKIRTKQLAMLNEVLEEEHLLNNYVVLGGDFNHDIANSANLFPTMQKRPQWVYDLEPEDINSNYSLIGATNAPTCRSTDIAYTKGVNYTVTLDGYIVSNNISIDLITNIDTDFEYSDHNPAYLEFTLL